MPDLLPSLLQQRDAIIREICRPLIFAVVPSPLSGGICAKPNRAASPGH
jgi:hypothetical protein